MLAAYISWRYPTSSGPIPVQDSPYDFTINVIDLYTLNSVGSIYRAPESPSEAPVALVSHGFLPATPLNPVFAVSLKTLELFRRIRLRKASFSVEAFAKIICDYYAIPYQRSIRKIMADTFDVYLSLLRMLGARISAALGHDGPDYRAKNSCPACTYKLKDEPSLPFQRMWVVDGNNSLKQMKVHGGRQAAADLRKFNSDYFLSPEYVDQFANEVKSRSAPSDETSDDEPDGEAAGDPTDGAPDLTSCTQNWKAAAADEKKKAWSVFEKTGIFAAACRHGFILWIADMVLSGELAKYALAMVAKFLEIDKDAFLLAYDIGCKFAETIKSSSLGEEFKARRARCCVNAFHGYSHNYWCQLNHHPNAIPGTGIEDLETLERIFSQSNALAMGTRYMSSYRRHMFIDLYFQQWDAEKYLNAATMLYNNLIQSSKIIQENTMAVQESLSQLGLTSADLDGYILDERDFFAQLGNEPAEDLHAIAYVELLQEYRKTCSELDAATSTFLTQTPTDYNFTTQEDGVSRYGVELSVTRQTETTRRKLREQRDIVLGEIIDLEIHLNIDTRWTPASPEYIKTLEYTSKRDYHRALDNLQRLVIQQLLEMHKAGLSQTGYKARQHIAARLQTRSKAIRRAVAAYNKAALCLDPVCDTLDWKKVSHYTFLDQFHILRDNRPDIHKKPWANPVIRDTIKQYQRLVHAHEEVQRCSIETRRIDTAIRDEQIQFRQVLLREQKSDLFHPLLDYVKRRITVNQSLSARIQQIYKLPVFQGIRGPGVRDGANTTEISEDAASEEVVPDGWLNVADPESDDEDWLDEEDDQELQRLVDLIGDLSAS
ncbi:hypothetical protein C8J56DRAFT_767478 [Mycena floridula]|nr:hypothetical protein C8J56DRAFT_767478 [Mycena floridula]